MTRLYQAVKQGDLALVKQYLAAGDDPNDVTDVFGSWESPLFEAVKQNNEIAKETRLEIARLLISYKANVNFQDDGTSRWTPLHLAASLHDVEFVELLLRSGARVDLRNDFGNTALYEAARMERGNPQDHPKTFKLLLDAHADINACNEISLSPFTLIFLSEKKDLIDLFKGYAKKRFAFKQPGLFCHHKKDSDKDDKCRLLQKR